MLRQGILLFKFVDEGLCPFESTGTHYIGEVADCTQFLRLLRLTCLLRSKDGFRCLESGP